MDKNTFILNIKTEEGWLQNQVTNKILEDCNTD